MPPAWPTETVLNSTVCCRKTASIPVFSGEMTRVSPQSDRIKLLIINELQKLMARVSLSGDENRYFYPVDSPAVVSIISKSLKYKGFSFLAWALRKRGQVALKRCLSLSHYKDTIMQKTKILSTLVAAAFLTAAVAAPAVYAADASQDATTPSTAQKTGAYVDD